MLGGTEGLKNKEKAQFANLEFLAVEKFYLWRDFWSDPFKLEGQPFGGGAFFFDEKEVASLWPVCGQSVASLER